MGERTFDSSKPGQAPRRAPAPGRLPPGVSNRTAARALQRLSVDDVIEGVTAPARKVFEWTVWEKFLEINRSLAASFRPPPYWIELAGRYAAQPEAKPDQEYLLEAFKHRPRFWIGGPVIKKLGKDTHAITLDRDIFFNPETSGEPSIDTFVHELVHVGQYSKLGVTAFLGSYTGEAVTHAIELHRQGKDVEKAYNLIVHERHAAAVEERFSQWRTKEHLTGDKEADERNKRSDEAAAEKKRLADGAEMEAHNKRGMEPLTHSVRIGGSVGAGGDNRPADVKAVAARLRQLAYLDASETDVADVTAAIRRYQRIVVKLAKPDGRIDPGGRTLASLNSGGLRLP